MGYATLPLAAGLFPRPALADREGLEHVSQSSKGARTE